MKFWVCLSTFAFEVLEKECVKNIFEAKISKYVKLFFVKATIQKVLQILISSLLHLKDKSKFFKKSLVLRPSTKLIGCDIEQFETFLYSPIQQDRVMSLVLDVILAFKLSIQLIFSARFNQKITYNSFLEFSFNPILLNGTIQERFKLFHMTD